MLSPLSMATHACRDHGKHHSKDAGAGAGAALMDCCAPRLDQRVACGQSRRMTAVAGQHRSPDPAEFVKPTNGASAEGSISSQLREYSVS